VAFGEDLTGGASSLPWLGVAMALLASTYLSVQYLLAIGRAAFIWILAVAVAVEIAVVARIGADLEEVAIALALIQAACAAVMLGVAAARTPAGELEKVTA
jgi:hypothetical protein